MANKGSSSKKADMPRNPSPAVRTRQQIAARSTGMPASNPVASPKFLFQPATYNSSPQRQETLSDGDTGSTSSPKNTQVAPLSRDYLEKVRPFIDLIDTLRAHGLDQDVALPAVAVIGDQSAGKSSALEAISGIQLPRGSGIVTRCPLVLRLKSTVQGNKRWRAQIQYKDTEGLQVKAEITKAGDIGDSVREAQKKITGDDRGISSELITLDVESADVPDLTLIDLPGIVRVATDGQAADIGDQIKSLIKDRIEKQTTIILAVVPANQDIATTEAIKLAKEFDPVGERTLGVVTKPDLIDKGTENELIAIVNNQTVPLKKGYTVVKCRGQQMIQQNVTLEQAIAEEEKFFREQPHFQEVDQSLLGVRNLSRKLTTELVNQIKGTIPDLKKEVADKINDTQEQLSHIGRELPTEPGELTFFCVRVLTEFSRKLKDQAECEMFAEARKVYNDFLAKMADKTPDYENREFIKKIEREVDEHRGRELPRFMNYKVCEKLIVDILMRYEDPAMQCLMRISDIVDGTMLNIADRIFQQFPKLNRIVKSRVSDLRLAACDVCHSRIKEILEMERIVFTQDKIYCHDLDIVKETYRRMGEVDYGSILVNNQPVQIEDFHQVPQFDPSVQKKQLTPDQGPYSQRDIVKETYRQIDEDRMAQFGGFNVEPISHKKKQQLPPDQQKAERLAKGHRLSSSSRSREADSEHKRTTAEEIFHMIQAYMEVSIRRIADYIPLTITLHLVRRLTTDVHVKVMAIVAEQDLPSIIYEDQAVVSHRASLKARLKRLETAKRELIKF